MSFEPQELALIRQGDLLKTCYLSGPCRQSSVAPLKSLIIGFGFLPLGLLADAPGRLLFGLSAYRHQAASADRLIGMRSLQYQLLGIAQFEAVNTNSG